MSDQAWRARNEMKPCTVQSCPKRRKDASRYCSHHRHKSSRTGHPFGRILRLEEIKPWRDAAQDFLTRHATAPQTTAAIGWLDSLLCGEIIYYGSSAAGNELRRLYDYGLQGEEALSWILGCWLYSEAMPRTLPDDARLTYCLAETLTKLTPRPRRNAYGKHRGEASVVVTTVGSAKAVLGQVLRDRLGVFCLRVVEAIAAEHTRAADLASTLGEPFEVPAYSSPAAAPTN